MIIRPEAYLCALPEGIETLKFAGYFDRERALIREWLARSPDAALRERLELEDEIAARMPLEFTVTRETLLELLHVQAPEATNADIDRVMSDGRADWRLVNGELRFHEDCADSLFLNAMRTLRHQENTPLPTPTPDPALTKLLETGSRKMCHRIRHTIAPRPGDMRDGQPILVHIPLPRTDALSPDGAQTNLVIHDMTPGGYVSDALQRTVSFETVCRIGMRFFVDYSFDAAQIYHPADGGIEVPCPNVQPSDLAEQFPHIRFTPYLRALCREIVGDETRPLYIARCIYDYITKNVAYSYMRNYLCIESIAEFAALNRRGDCGVQALLFITLCRIAGVPARWQSGMTLKNGRVGSHDWARYCADPYGWLYADPARGGSSWLDGDTVRHDFYARSSDPQRMATCDAFQTDFDPPKRHTRSDPYDNQIGEIEYADGPLYQIDCKRELLESADL
mgnify:CR=1 FL=1